MLAQNHLSQRGSVYQWRRRVRSQSTGIIDIKLSLGTTDRRVAAILARKISAESDHLMDQINSNSITPAEARAWLGEVIRRERQKIEQLQMLRRIESDDPADDARHDEAMRDAWQHLAQAGLNGRIPDGTQDLVRSNIEILRQDLTSESRRNIVARDFRNLTGRERVSAFELMTLMTLLISGKKAAWAGYETALQPIDTLADEIARQAPSALIGSEPRPTPPAKTALEAPPSQSLPASTPSAKDPTISAVIERMILLKRREGIEEKTLQQYRSFGKLFILLTGIADIRDVLQSDATSFRASLRKLPKSWGKSPADQTATREEVMARAAALRPDQVGLSVGTINRHLEHLGQIVASAADEGIPVDPRLNPAKLRRKDPVRDSDKRDAFTPVQLERIFRGPVWSGSESEYYQTRPGPTTYHNGLYWCPLIGAVTGARREEIAGLAPNDIVTVDGIPCFSIAASDQRRVKTLSSQRVVPIHSRLIELGFLDYVARIRAKGHPDLFPDLREPTSGQHGRKLGRRMRQVIDETLGAEGAALSFHSLRHYVQNALERAKIDDKIIRDIVGHEGRDVHDKVYHKPVPPDIMQPAIESLTLAI
ncbi:site-specific integrase [Rhodobacter capsulatus]|uniref:Phage integrase family protein n=1 Tax=Rhodobacter capsulatus TaxID=1061 RepID=A0A1G7R3V0_RHOCA|nr:site-specific integrase [Rhodobacter capsulatus]WER08397.1 site-specific integrase [Rhodobacter capsulatus]SDG05446.1 Phage integrase family protein [Rhodobacter capsulatus]